MGLFKIIQPRSITNLVTNPSLERDLTSPFTTGSGNTLSVITGTASKGTRALKSVTTGSSNNLIMLANPSGLSASTQYCFSVDIWADDWDGGDISLVLSGFTSVVTDVASGSITAGSAGPTRLFIIFTLDSDTTGTIIIQSGSAGSTGFILADRFLLAQTDGSGHEVTYVDGDMEGAWWEWSPHAATSVSDPDRAWNVGDYLDFDTDLSCPIESATGLGASPVKNVTVTRPGGPGAEFQGVTVQPTRVTLNGTFTGTSQANYHTLRDAVMGLVNPQATRKPRPVVLVYDGADVRKVLTARYEDGLQLQGPVGYMEEVTIILTAYEWPYWTEDTGRAATLDVNDTMTMESVIYQVSRGLPEDATWDQLDVGASPSGYNINVAFRASDGKIYIGGNFTNWGDANGDYIVYWDPEDRTINSMGTGMSAQVQSITEGPDGDIYVGGEFLTAGGTTVRYIAKWNGSAWSALGPPSAVSGATPSVNHMAWGTDGFLYIAGVFTNWDGDASADQMAKWDGSAWSPIDGTTILGSTGGGVNAMAYDPATKLLYLGGSFLDVGGDTSLTLLVSWDEDSGTWDIVGPSVPDDDVNDLVLDSLGNLWLAGDFTTLGGVSCDLVGRFDGHQFHSLGTGTFYMGAATGLGLDCLAPDGRGGCYVTTGATIRMAVGKAEAAATGFQSFLHYDGSAWSIVPVLTLNPTSSVQGWNRVEVDGHGDLVLVASASAASGNPAQQSGQVTVTNPGSGPAWPVATFRRTTTGVTSPRAVMIDLHNRTTGAQIHMAFDLELNEVVTIDFRPKSLGMWTQNGVDGPRVKSWRMLPGSDPGNFFLNPGDNVITAFMYLEGATLPTIEAFLEFVPNHWGVD